MTPLERSKAYADRKAQAEKERAALEFSYRWLALSAAEDAVAVARYGSKRGFLHPSAAKYRQARLDAQLVRM